MTARYLKIDEKHRRMAGMVANIADFTVSAGEMVDAETVVNNPNVSLYCFNHEAQTAIFTELPEGVNLASVPFVYQTQYEQAQRLIEMDYEAFKGLAQTLPAVEHLIMIYITGRSGSTLMSNVFNELDDVVSLSEPDVGTEFFHLRDRYGMPEAELQNLLDCAVRMLFKPTPFKTPSTCALKLRGEGTKLIDLYQATFPDVKNLYLYRDAPGFVASFYRLLKRGGMPDAMPTHEFTDVFAETALQDMRLMVAETIAPDLEQLTLIQFLTLWWAATIEWYLEQYARGLPILAVNYTDMNQKREATLKAIFDYSGLPSERVTEALGAFDRDSQAGTALAREKPTEGNALQLSDAQMNQMQAILARHPVFKGTDYLIPGLLVV